MDQQLHNLSYVVLRLDLQLHNLSYVVMSCLAKEEYVQKDYYEKDLSSGTGRSNWHNWVVNLPWRLLLFKIRKVSLKSLPILLAMLPFMWYNQRTVSKCISQWTCLIEKGLKQEGKLPEMSFPAIFRISSLSSWKNFDVIGP